MAICDVYDALTSSRPYKAPQDTVEAAQIIIDSAGIHFDPVLVELFKTVADEFADIASWSIFDCADGHPF
jgi:putative two-component system response regulator